MVVESAIPELAKRPVGVENALPEPAKRRLLVEGFAPVQQNDPKLLQVHLRCSANKTIVDGIDGRALVSIRLFSYMASGVLPCVRPRWAVFRSLGRADCVRTD